MELQGKQISRSRSSERLSDRGEIKPTFNRSPGLCTDCTMIPQFQESLWLQRTAELITHGLLGADSESQFITLPLYADSESGATQWTAALYSKLQNKCLLKPSEIEIPSSAEGLLSAAGWSISE